MSNKGSNVLFLTPVLPAASGNGLAMRAYHVLRALSHQANVYLLIIPHYPCPVPLSFDEIKALCAACVYLPPGGAILTMADWVQAAAKVWKDSSFDIIHFFRLATLPFGEAYLSRHATSKPLAYLDLDDVESLAHRRLATVLRLGGRLQEAEKEELLADQVQVLEEKILSQFDRIYVCSSLDRERLLPHSHAELVVLPNVIELPKLVSEQGQKNSNQPFTFLFVGTLGYFPNEDAILSFCQETWTRLLALSPTSICLNIVGTGPTANLYAGTKYPGVNVIGPVPDVATAYANADAVIVPLRAGGGTRIKVLEAFARKKPVVSTTLGIEGIEALAKEHYLLADSPIDFAHACAQLIKDPMLADRLAVNAYELVKEKYTLNRMIGELNRRNSD